MQKRDKSGGMLIPKDRRAGNRGPVADGLFTLTKKDLKDLVDMVREGEEAQFRIAMWPKRVSSRGNEYWGLTLDDFKPEKREESRRDYGEESRRDDNGLGGMFGGEEERPAKRRGWENDTRAKPNDLDDEIPF